MQTYEGRLSRAATAGQYFAAELVEPAGLTDLSVDWPHDVDLAFEQAKDGTWLLSGMVETAKLHEFTLHGKIKGKPAKVALRLPVSPDPWSMWKDLPVDWDTTPYPKTNGEAFRQVGDGLMVAASKRGRSHAHKALPRDDDVRIHFDEETGWHIMAVADGAGSAAFSRLGSETVVETAIAELPHLLHAHLPDPSCDDPETGLRKALCATLRAAADALDIVAQDSGHKLQDLSTTLLIGVARQVPTGWFFASISVGDGLVGLMAPGTAPLMMDADHGEFAGQTTFLRSDLLPDDDQLAKRIHHRTVSEFTAFMLMTDGVSDPMFTSQSATHDASAWSQLLEQINLADVGPESPDPAGNLLDWLNFRVKGEHDDRTIAILFPNGASV